VALAGDPVTVRSHDSRTGTSSTPSRTALRSRRATPGSSNVGTDGNTAALAWNCPPLVAGCGPGLLSRCPGLLVTCDSGGSNGCTNKGVEGRPGRARAGTGLDIEVCHFPPGRASGTDRAPAVLPDQLSLASPSPDQLRRHHSTPSAGSARRPGSRHRRLDENAYPAGTQIRRRADARHRGTLLTPRRDWHGEWNYTLLAHPAPPGRPCRPHPRTGRQET